MVDKLLPRLRLHQDCFRCGGFGHFAARCPLQSSLVIGNSDPHQELVPINYKAGQDLAAEFFDELLDGEPIDVSDTLH